MVWTCYTHVDRTIQKKKLTKPRGRPRTRWLNQIREDIEDRGQTWIELHTTKTWEDREGWSLCNSRPKWLETTWERRRRRERSGTYLNQMHCWVHRWEWDLRDLIAASLHKRLGACLPPLGSRVRVLVTPCGFRGGRNGVWVGFSRGFSRFLPFSPTTNFIPPFLHTHLIHFVSFHQPMWWCIRRGRPAPLLLMDL